MKNASDRLTSRKHTAEERLSKLENILIESLKTEKQREQRLRKTEQNIGGLWENNQMCNLHVMEIVEVKERQRNRRNI